MNKANFQGKLKIWVKSFEKWKTCEVAYMLKIIDAKSQIEVCIAILYTFLEFLAI